MFSNYFARFEAWVRRIIRDEVCRIDTSLQHERETLQSNLRVFNAQAQAFNAAVDRIVEISYFKENTELRTTIKELTAHGAGIVDIVKQLHPTT